MIEKNSKEIAFMTEGMQKIKLLRLNDYASVSSGKKTEFLLPA